MYFFTMVSICCLLCFHISEIESCARTKPTCPVDQRCTDKRTSTMATSFTPSSYLFLTYVQRRTHLQLQLITLITSSPSYLVGDLRLIVKNRKFCISTLNLTDMRHTVYLPPFFFSFLASGLLRLPTVVGPTPSVSMSAGKRKRINTVSDTEASLAQPSKGHTHANNGTFRVDFSTIPPSCYSRYYEVEETFSVHWLPCCQGAL